MSEQSAVPPNFPFLEQRASPPIRYARALKRFVLTKRLGAFGLLILLVFTVLWAFGPQIRPYGPNEIFEQENPDYNPDASIDELRKNPELSSPILLNRYSDPTGDHWFGTDRYGRDILSRVISGVELAMIIGLGASLIATTGSVLLGLLSGYYVGTLDLILQRIIDAMQAFPALVFLLLLVQVAEPSVRNAVLALGVIGIPTGTRLIRSVVLSVREAEYVTAARLLGASDARVMFRHVLPNVAAIIIVSFTVLIGGYILAEASLSFLGLGPGNVVSWGAMVSDGRIAIALHPWETLAAGGAITLVVVAFNFLGDAVRDVLDPRLRGG